MKYLLALIIPLVILASCNDSSPEQSVDDLIPVQVRAASIISTFTLDADVNIRIQTDNIFGLVNDRVGFEVFTIFTDNEGNPVTSGSLSLSTYGEIPVGLYGDVGHTVNDALLSVNLTDDQYETLTYESVHPDLGDFSREVFLETDFVAYTNFESWRLPENGDDIKITWTPSSKDNQRVIVGVTRPDYSYEVYEVADNAGEITIPVDIFSEFVGSGENALIAIVRGYEDCFESSNGEKICVLSYGTSYSAIKL